MDRHHQKRSALIRSALAVVLVFALLQAGRTTDLLSWLTRPTVATVLSLFHADAADHGTHFTVGRLTVPWTRDCAGFDVLLVLWGLILWTSRQDLSHRRFWIRLAAAVPAAVLANVARVLTIIGWREAVYPAVESPQMHYFMGFVWLLPLLALFVPRSGRPWLSWAVETGMLAAALSLAAPQASAPGGTWVTACTLVALATHRWHGLPRALSLGAGAVWVLAAVAIAGSAMESLWLPWLLLCPWCAPTDRKLVTFLPLAAGTVPLVAMNWPWLAVAALVGAGWELWRHESTTSRPTASAGRQPWPALLLVLVALPGPFVASTLGPALLRPPAPPRGLMARTLEPGVRSLALLGQEPDVALFWHDPSGNGRHHTLAVCMRYRGVNLTPETTADGVLTDGRQWMAEAFLMPDGRLLDYEAYLRATFRPFSAPGVHLIASAPSSALGAAGFQASARRLFGEVSALMADGGNSRPAETTGAGLTSRN